MLPELGHFALILALCMAILQSVPPLIGVYTRSANLVALARPAAQLQLLFISISMFCLGYAFVVHDFSVAYVANNSNTALPLLFRISAIWGAHEGSLLLWALILAIWTNLLIIFSKSLPTIMRARVIAVVGLISIGFILFMLLTSNPFDRLFQVPIEGRDLNPLLQDFGLAVHPPMLYMGYVGLVVPFSLAIAAMLGGGLDAAWARWSRPWTTMAWLFLTLGIALGSWWAYYELGWGGWWFWDPVENASFMPWLAGTALLHSAIVVEKRDALKSWTIFLAILAFSFSLLGTFLVRSGALTSVHAFATDPTRGVFILFLLCLTVGGSLMLYAWRAPTLKGGGLFQPISREGALVFNNVLLSIAAAMVLLGTLYPLLLETVTGEKISVGAPFFNSTFVPIMTPAIIAMVFGPLMPWKRADLFAVLGKLKIAIAAVILVLLVTYWLAGGPAFALFGMGLATWLFVGTILEWTSRIKLFRGPLKTSLRRMRNLPRSAHGTMLAHAGVAIVVAGITGSQAWTEESVQSLGIGDSTVLSGHTFTLSSLREYEGPNFVAREATITIATPGERTITLTPEKRVYTVEGMPTTEAGIQSGITGDIYAVIGDEDANGKWVTRFYVKPMIPWMWTGGLVMVLGGLMSLSDRRYRVGAPARSTKAAPTVPAE